MPHQVNWPKLRDALEIACEMRNMSLADVAEEIGVSPSGLSRMRQGRGLTADNLAALIAWLYPKRVPHWVQEVS